MFSDFYDKSRPSILIIAIALFVLFASLPLITDIMSFESEDTATVAIEKEADASDIDTGYTKEVDIETDATDTQSTVANEHDMQLDNSQDKTDNTESFIGTIMICLLSVALFCFLLAEACRLFIFMIESEVLSELFSPIAKLFAPVDSYDFRNSFAKQYYSKKKVSSRKLKKFFNYVIEKGYSNSYITQAFSLAIQENPIGEDKFLPGECLIRDVLKMYHSLIPGKYSEPVDYLSKIKTFLDFSAYLFQKAPCCMSEEDAYSCQKRILLVLVKEIMNILGNQNFEWDKDNTNKQKLEEMIRESGLPLIVKDLRVVPISFYIGYAVKSNKDNKKCSDIEEPRDKMQTQNEKDNAPQVSKSNRDVQYVIDSINDAIKYVKDDETRLQMAKSQKMLRIVDELIRQEEQPREKTRKLLTYYLPTYSKMLKSYSDTNKCLDGLQIENNQIFSKEIGKSVSLINEVIASYINDCFQENVWDVQTDLSVLETIMCQDGYVKTNITKNAF